MIENLSVLAVGGKTPDGKASQLLKEGLELTGVESHPNVLIIPTAKPTQEAYSKSKQRTDRLYQEILGVPLEYLHGFDSMPHPAIIDELLEWADLVYITGGDTKRMMKIWEKYGIDSKLKIRAFGGVVLTGISAGAIAPFRWGHSDSDHYYNDSWDYKAVEALGLINAGFTPHNNSLKGTERREIAFGRMFTQESARLGTKIGIGVDNFAGIKINDGKLELRIASPDSGATIFDARTGETITSRMDVNQPITLGELGLSS